MQKYHNNEDENMKESIRRKERDKKLWVIVATHLLSSSPSSTLKNEGFLISGKDGANVYERGISNDIEKVDKKMKENGAEKEREIDSGKWIRDVVDNDRDSSYVSEQARSMLALLKGLRRNQILS